MTRKSDVSARLAEAISQGKTGAFLRSSPQQGKADQELLAAAEQALVRISGDMLALKAELVDLLRASGCSPASVPGPEETNELQYQEITLRIPPAEVKKAASCLASQGFEPPFSLTPGRLAALVRYQSILRFVRFDGETTRVALQFRKPPPHSRFRPSMADIARSGLPAPLVWLLPAARAGRVLTSRLTGGAKGAQDTEFLGTPESLIQPLLELAGPGMGRHLMDMGCGDGRILLAAAKAGWTATGVELNPQLAELAQKNVASAGLDGQVTVLCQPAETASLKDVDVLFLFLPLYIATPMLKKLLNAASFAGRIILHEQHALPPGLAPDRSIPVISHNALTVAHIWDR